MNLRRFLLPGEKLTKRKQRVLEERDWLWQVLTAAGHRGVVHCGLTVLEFARSRGWSRRFGDLRKLGLLTTLKKRFGKPAPRRIRSRPMVPRKFLITRAIPTT